MNWKHQEMAKHMMGEWALNMGNIPSVVATFKRYLGEYAPSLIDTLNDQAAEDYFTKALHYRHFGWSRRAIRRG